jgi:hypothetical protein
MGDVVKFNDSVPALLQDAFGIEDNDALSSGLSGGFSTMSIKGSKFRIKCGGEETVVVDEEGLPKMGIEVVIAKASEFVAKTFYEGDYTEGTAGEPDCYSLDGQKPSSRSPRPQSELCGICPKGKFGSKMTADGRETKACSDSRRVVVVPANDITNEQYGGPMLLRIPVMSLGDLGTYGKAMKAKGFPYNTVVTRLSFDPDVAYPKLMFKAVRPLNQSEASELVEHFSAGNIDSMLVDEREVTKATADKVSGMAHKPKPKPPVKKSVDTDFETTAEEPSEDAETEESKALKKKKKTAKKKAARKIKAQPDAEEVEQAPETIAVETTDDELDGELDELFGGMDD